MRAPLRGAGRIARNGSHRGQVPGMRRHRVEAPDLALRARAPPAHAQPATEARGQARHRSGRRRAALQATASGGAPRGIPAGRPEGQPLMDAAARREALVEVYNRASVCELCPLAETRNTVVFGAGNADADLMFVGEAPGAEEDRQ